VIPANGSYTSALQNSRVIVYSAQDNYGSIHEPLMCFIGDADMTVDPVLAQGITIAMEDSAEVARCVERSYGAAAAPGTHHEHPFDALRHELIRRYEKKGQRLICLLRATELVQTLAQPSGEFLGIVARSMRPLMKYGAPDFVKKRVFDWMMKYSLGLKTKH